MGKIFVALAFCAMLLAFAGCVQEEQKAKPTQVSPEVDGSPGRTLDAPSEIAPGGAKEPIVPKPPITKPNLTGIDRGVKKNTTSLPPRNATAEEEKAPPKLLILESSFTDNEYGIYFALPKNIEIITTGCEYWGGSPSCEAIILWDNGRTKFAELAAQKYDFGTPLRTYLEKQGYLAREKNSTWFVAKFGSREAYVREYDWGGNYSRLMYTLLGGKLVKFYVAGTGQDAMSAKEVWESLAIGGAKAKEYYPVEYGCVADRNCYSGEVCYSKSFCVNLNASDSKLVDYFNSTSACSASGGLSRVCKRECEFDSECPKGQDCFSLRRTDGQTVQVYHVCT